MQAVSLWEQTLTFFPQFQRALAEQSGASGTVTVVGASDGKFVLPLAEAGYEVIAIEKDPLALYGGDVLLPITGLTYAPGLVQRLKDANLSGRVHIEPQDLFDTVTERRESDAVWTSCSWHYSTNHRRPFRDFVTRMQAIVRPGGLFGAEFMMPVEDWHHRVEHYTTPSKLLEYFAEDSWTVLLSFETEPFTERAHVGQLRDHVHQMGVLIAMKLTHEGDPEPR